MHHYPPTIGSDHYDPRHRCCCNSMHVERGAFVIAVWGTFFSAMAVGGNLVSPYQQNVVPSLISMCIFLCIFAAQNKRVPALYLPFLFVNAISIISLAFILSAGILLAVVAMPELTFDYMERNSAGMLDHDLRKWEGFYLLLTLFIVVYVCFLATNVWLFAVVFRAYKYMKAELNGQMVAHVVTPLVHQEPIEIDVKCGEAPPPYMV